MADPLSMSLDDLIAKRNDQHKKERKPQGGAGSGKAPRREKPADTRPARRGNEHDDRRSKPAGKDLPRAGTKKVAVVGIGNMDTATIREIFGQGGLKVLHVDIETTGRGSRLGVVTFARFEEAEKAIAEYDNALVDGKEIHVHAYKEKREESRAPQRAAEVAHTSSIVVKKPCSKVRVANLPFDVKGDDLAGIFRDCGRILDSSVNRGTGFVDFQNVDAAKAAIRDFDGAEVNGRVIEVSYAK